MASESRRHFAAHLGVLSAAFALQGCSSSQPQTTVESVANPRLQGATISHFLPPREGNPRNTEGSFVTLKDGRILFAYTKFTGGTDDHAAAIIAGRYSSDQGVSWTPDDITLVDQEGKMNVMSVSLLRLQDDRIAMFYLLKNSAIECIPYLRTSSDEGVTWSKSTRCIQESAYWVLNNDRVIQTTSGRLVMPVGMHPPRGDKYNPRSTTVLYLSDDAGATWRRAKTELECPTDSARGFQEPGVVERKNGSLFLFIRTRLGSQYVSYSQDGGETWTPAVASGIRGPLAPASMKRIPSTGDLLLVWNDHAGVPVEMRADESAPGQPEGKRTPLTVAISKDDGETWEYKQNLADDPTGWYCYTAIHFVGDHVLLAYASGGAGLPGLSKMDLARIPIAALYPKDGEKYPVSRTKLG